ncbi:MAG: aminopeptidase P family protein [Eubacterium sp.]|nr:aminopeptidase P family protein [Eubacterium sp.]
MIIDYSDLMLKSNVNALLITDPYNLRYYTGFRGGEGMALITDKNSRVLITDSRYTEAAEKECYPGYTVRQFDSKISFYDILMEYIISDHIYTIGFENESISYSLYCKFVENICESSKYDVLKKQNSFEEAVRLKPLSDTLLIPRQIKTSEEIELLRQAEHIGDMAFEDILNILKPGMTELEVAAELEYSMKRHGAEGFSFDTIAASGVNSSMPHAIPCDKKLASGDFLTMDFGCVYKGYCSDMTRTVCIGKASDEQKKIYDIVLTAQMTVLDKVRPGMKCKEVDSIARDYIASQGYGQYFGHGLGHGVGLYIHESPAFNTRDTSILKAGMIETDEPGIYLPGRFGVRIEDMILITEDGCESLAKSPKQLIEI